MKRSLLAISFVAAMLLSVSCADFWHQLFNQPISSHDLETFKKVFMSSYYAERGVSEDLEGKALTPFLSQTAGSKATVPITSSYKPNFSGLATATALGNYPEPGQTTSFTAVAVSGVPAGLKVYDVTATTTYTSSDLRSTYVEEYYIQDIGLNAQPTPWNTGDAPDGVWTTADPIVKKVGGVWVAGTNNILTQDQNARIQQVLTFRDGTTRTETIVSNSNAAGPKYDPAAFDINGSLSLSQVFIPASTSASSVVYSSAIIYTITPVKTYNFWFWQGSESQTVLGVRYYTEEAGPSSFVKSTASFEKTISTITTTGGSYLTTVQGVLANSPFDTLAESVLRQRIVYGISGGLPTGTGQITTNMQTRVIDITGSKSIYLDMLNTDSIVLSELGNPAYAPAGSADAILVTTPNALAFARTQQVTPQAGTIPFAVSTSDVGGYGAVGIVYTSIEQGAAVSAPLPPEANVPPTNVQTADTVATFNGQQTMGSVEPFTTDLSKKGSIEAWVRITNYTDTAGIVHKGVLVDFSDECFSLQGWGNSGQIAFVLDAAGGGSNYDLVASTINLQKAAWYYLVAAWDTTLGNSSYIRLYINGSLNKSMKPVKTANGAQNNDSALVIGSQLPSVYSTAYGYFGLNGKVTGVNLSATPLTAAQVTTNYNLYKGSTASW
jgi:hypothetical protein